LVSALALVFILTCQLYYLSCESTGLHENITQKIDNVKHKTNIIHFTVTENSGSLWHGVFYVKTLVLGINEMMLSL
jgi:hypothetical protein